MLRSSNDSQTTFHDVTIDAANSQIPSWTQRLNVTAVAPHTKSCGKCQCQVNLFTLHLFIFLVVYIPILIHYCLYHYSIGEIFRIHNAQCSKKAKLHLRQELKVLMANSSKGSSKSTTTQPQHSTTTKSKHLNPRRRMARKSQQATAAAAVTSMLVLL